MDPSPAGASLVILIWVLTAISVLIVGLRIVAKVMIHQFRLDDILMIIALILGIIASVFNTLSVHYGYGYRSSEISEVAYQVLARKYYIVGQGILIASAAVGRASLIAYLLYILWSQKLQRIAMITLAVMEVSINLGAIIVIFAGCKPTALNWDYSLPGTCASPQVTIDFGYFQSIFNVIIDLYLATAPTYIFWNLNLKLPIKISLIALMSSGLVAMGAALAKTIQLPDIAGAGGTLGGTTSLLRWGYIETYLVIITASVPCLRSLVLSGFHYMNSSGHRSRSYEFGTAYTGTRRGTASVTAHNNSQHRRTDSRLRGMLSGRYKGHDGASAHYILESRTSLDAAKSSDSSQERMHAQIGIQKQVDVTITTKEN